MLAGGGYPKIKMVHDQQTAPKNVLASGGQWLSSMYHSQQLHQGELHKLLIIFSLCPRIQLQIRANGFT